MKYVIDASIGFKWLVIEPWTNKARRLRDEYRHAVHELVAPDLFPTEVANAIAVAERRGRIPAGDGALLLRDLLKALPVLHPGLPDLLPRAYAFPPRHSRVSTIVCTRRSPSTRSASWSRRMTS